MSTFQVARTASVIALLALSIAGCAAGGSGDAASDEAQTAVAAATTDAPVSTTAPDTAAEVPAPDADPLADLCAYLPPDAAAMALGEPVDGGTAKHGAAFDNASCRYQATGSSVSLTIWFHPDLTRDDWEATMVKTGMADQEVVSGIGESAYRRIGSSTSSEIKLTAFETDHDVWVIIAGAHESDAMSTALETIALSVLAAVD